MSNSEEADETQVYDALLYPEKLVPATEYVTFGLDGLQHRIELGKTNATRLRRLLAPFVERAYSTTGTERRRLVGAPTSEHRSQSRERRARNQAIRQWAAQNRLRLNPQGRIPDEVVAAYEQDQSITHHEER